MENTESNSFYNEYQQEVDKFFCREVAPQLFRVAIDDDVDQIGKAFGNARRVFKSDDFCLGEGTIRDSLVPRCSNGSDYDFYGNLNLDAVERELPKMVVNRWDNVNTIRLKIDDETYDFINTNDVATIFQSNDVNISNMGINSKGELLDLVGGVESLSKREIKINNPFEKIYKEPHLIFRVVRFSIALELTEKILNHSNELSLNKGANRKIKEVASSSMD